MGILLGVLTALAWGSSDFFARFATRRIGALRTTLYMQLAGLVLLTVSMRWIGGWGHLADGSGWQPWAWGALAGVVNGISTLALYRSFEVGKMAVVAPLSASYPALTVVLSLFTGEHLTMMRAAGIAFILVGVVFVARGDVSAASDDRASQLAARTERNGLGVPLCAWLRRALLAARHADRPKRRCCIHGLDDSTHVLSAHSSCDPVSQAAHRAAARRFRFWLAPRHGRAGHRRLRLEQPRNAAGASVGYERSRFSLWRGHHRPRRDRSSRTSFALAMVRRYRHLRRHRPDQPLARSPRAAIERRSVWRAAARRRLSHVSPISNCARVGRFGCLQRLLVHYTPR